MAAFPVNLPGLEKYRLGSGFLPQLPGAGPVSAVSAGSVCTESSPGAEGEHAGLGSHMHHGLTLLLSTSAPGALEG